jgi:hypothetical protein
VFKGDTRVNLLPELGEERFRARLGELGCVWSVSKRTPGREPVAWYDYRDADVLVAVRHLSPAYADSKPASKLVNAWMAGVPALLGPESAFRDLRESAYDYLEVRSADEVLAAIRWLKEHPGVYREMVRNGLARARAFAVDRLTASWWSYLTGPEIAVPFQEQLRLGWVGKRVDLARRLLRHRVVKARRLRQQRTAVSILDGPSTLVLPAMQELAGVG